VAPSRWSKMMIDRTTRCRMIGPTTSSLRGAKATKQSSFTRKPLDCFAAARNDEVEIIQSRRATPACLGRGPTDRWTE
jgi:hypothetical protein